MDKISLRKIIKQKRSELDIKEISHKIVLNILASDIFKVSENIALYYPLENEINLLELLNIPKNFYFPKCIDNDLYFTKYSCEFVMGEYGINEAKGDIIDPKILDIIYIPCLCANKNCYRLGYGKGFYDRFFSGHNLTAKKIIVCADCFILDEFIEDKFDFRCDEIISEKHI